MKALAVELSKRSRAGAPRGSPGVPVDARTAECGGRPTSCALAIKVAPRSADQLQSTRESLVRAAGFRLAARRVGRSDSITR